MFDWLKGAFDWGIGKVAEALDFSGVIKLFLLELIQSVLDGSFKILQDTVLAYDNYKVLPHTDTLIDVFSQIAIYLLTFFLIYKAMNMMITGGLGNDVDFIKLMFDTAKAFIFIKITPWLIQFFLLAMNKAIVEFILKDDTLDMQGAKKLDFADNIAKIIGVKSLKKIGAIADTERIQYFGLFLVFVIAICILIFNIYGALRLVNIVICLIVAPVMASTRVISDDYWRVYVTETIAVIFSQIFHVLCLYWILTLVGENWTLGRLFLIIALIIVGISGAHIIRRFTFATGASSIVGGAGKMAVYKFMVRR
ncbi:hypothetical protein O0I16_10820 [Staphylococcus pseudintermedius]|uniref:hypothetical protein n=1 Tax=Staphylococcus pseudintermedius TaxID=283734 RepID=UPI00143F1FCE|nr:hypothetical protein [Staphylococcus pseudintermedius]EGQ3717865.1 hypothetical protein [Staphylococcus pseudintermedius]MDE9985315.1 hypothetical protein [Staphylococcus pseudintermedius]MDE9987678.1 hypothetical protein [Staphylococcus pseudintermedius]MDE9999680.1 hypothetical protein [Staphylococcus pseudintermedius]MDF0029736.1 hypothetical protein [Staphylococcus pseudintermedius]